MGDGMKDGAQSPPPTNRVKKGRHPDKALSAAFVRTVAQPGKYFDGHGLYLRVDATGARRWVQRIVIRGRRVEMGLGSASLVSLAEARELAISNRKLAREGGDPLRAKRESQEVLTFEEAAQKVWELNRPGWRNQKHSNQFISTLREYAFPRLGSIKVSDITVADVHAALAPIWLEKGETARRVRQRIGKVLKWTIAQGWRQDNPASVVAESLPKQDRTPNHHKALHYDEVARCIEEARQSGATDATKLALELLVLTACRSGEIRGMRWEEVNLAGAEWNIPSHRMKANRSHRVPLSHRALEILEEAKLIDDGSGLVFPSARFGKPLSDATLAKLIKELGFDATAHGFRTSFKTWCQERTSVSRELSEAALAHRIRDRSEAAYARSDMFQKRRQLMDRWASYLNDDRGKVVSIK